MTNKEVMQTALDALVEAQEYVESEGWPYDFSESIESLRAALAQPEHKEQWSNGYKAGYAQAQETDLAMPRKEWVGLTDDEITKSYEQAWNEDRDAWSVKGFAHAIEAKLKEKNGF